MRRLTDVQPLKNAKPSGPRCTRVRESRGGSPLGGLLPKKISSFVMLATACVALTFGVAACNKTNIQQDGAQSQPAQTDNLAPVDGVQTADASYQQPATQTTQQNYQQPAPVRHTSSRRVAQQYAPNQNDPNYDSDGGYQD